MELTPAYVHDPNVSALPESYSSSDRSDLAEPPQGDYATARIKSCGEIWVSIPDDTCNSHGVWLKLSAVPMEPAMVGEFERFTAWEPLHSLSGTVKLREHSRQSRGFNYMKSIQ
jgi:hypothetical protein